MRRLLTLLMWVSGAALAVAYIVGLFTFPPSTTCFGACPPIPAPGVVLEAHYDRRSSDKPCSYRSFVILNRGTTVWATEGWAVNGLPLGQRTLAPGRELRFHREPGTGNNNTIYLSEDSEWSIMEGVIFTDPHGQTYRSEYMGSCFSLD